MIYTQSAKELLLIRGNQAKLRATVFALTGRRIAKSTTSNWATGKKMIPPCAEALVLILYDDSAK